MRWNCASSFEESHLHPPKADEGTFKLGSGIGLKLSTLPILCLLKEAEETRSAGLNTKPSGVANEGDVGD